MKQRTERRRNRPDPQPNEPAPQPQPGHDQGKEDGDRLGTGQRGQHDQNNPDRERTDPDDRKPANPRKPGPEDDNTTDVERERDALHRR